MSNIKGNIVVNDPASGNNRVFNPKTEASQVYFADGETLEQKFKKWIPDHAILSDRAGTADRSDLSEDTRKFMGHPIEDFLMREELLSAIYKAIDMMEWKPSVEHLEDLAVTYPNAKAGDLAMVRGGDPAGSIYRFDGNHWVLAVRAGETVIPNNVIDKINKASVIRKKEFANTDWIKQGDNDYTLSIRLFGAEILQVYVSDNNINKISTITPEYNDNNVVIRSIEPESGYILYYLKDEPIAIERN